MLQVNLSRKWSVVVALFALILLAACAQPEQVEVTREVTREVEQEVVITEVVEQEVTRVVEQEVTRIIEQLVEVAVTVAPPPAEAVDPTLDRVGFPENYQEEFVLFYEFDRPDNRSARVIYANEIAASVTAEQISAASVVPGDGFPYGSILVMEVYRTERDEADQVLLDENGRYVRGELFGLFVMRKEPGFGLKYGGHRNGEWEYVAYRPDATVLTPPERTDACAACHMEAGLGNDYVFGWPRAFGIESPEVGENEINIVDYRFTPNVITVTVGTEVTWTNNDVVFHTVTQTGGSFSATLRQAASAGFTFEEATAFQYICAIHPQMSGEIRVVEP